MNNIFATHSMHGIELHAIVQVPKGFIVDWLSAIDHDGRPVEVWRTEQAARRATVLRATLACIDDDILVFGAPSEFYTSAAWRAAWELDAIEDQHIVGYYKEA